MASPLHTELEGPVDAPPLVCLHGGIGTGRYHWSRQVPSLAEHYRVHLPDLPGHGHSPFPARAEYGAGFLADAVEGYLERIGPPVHVAGFSMGGHAALHVAARRPELFASLALVGVATAHHPGLDEWRARFDPDRLATEWPAWARALARLHAPLGDEAWREVLDRDSSGVTHAEVDLDALEKLAAPLLLVRGDRDPVVPVQQYAELRTRSPFSEELVVNYGGHDVQLTRAEIVRPALRDFLDRSAG
ncbi:alpha/beta fold hydrolase [Egibacter rhizosphaerae]|nr:alpha/beta hydrolase [Egibacter rhizosphaerae]